MNLLSKLRNIIKYGRVTNIDSDTGQFPQAQYEYFDKVKDVVNVYPYGMNANAPIDTLSLILNVGHEENSVAIPMNTDLRKKGLSSGESVFGNFVVGSYVYFKSNGDIEVISKNEVSVTAPTINIVSTTTHDGNVTINGDLQVNGDITSTGTIEGNTVQTSGGIDLDTHVHSTSTNPSGPPQ